MVSQMVQAVTRRKVGLRKGTGKIIRLKVSLKAANDTIRYEMPF